MPNLKPPVTTVDLAAAYRGRILSALPAGTGFEPLMTLYLTDNTPPGEVAKAAESGFVKAVKLYPAGATTNSDAGLTDIRKADATLAEMERLGLPLLVHGEVTDPAIDLFDREKVFIDTVLVPLVQRFPRLKVVMEHITTRDAAEFVLDSPSTVAATITAHHLLYNRNAIFQGGVRPHWYCLPVLKREMHREALVAAAISGNPKFFRGTDISQEWVSVLLQQLRRLLNLVPVLASECVLANLVALGLALVARRHRLELLQVGPQLVGEKRKKSCSPVRTPVDSFLDLGAVLAGLGVRADLLHGVDPGLPVQSPCRFQVRPQLSPVGVRVGRTRVA